LKLYESRKVRGSGKRTLPYRSVIYTRQKRQSEYKLACWHWKKGGVGKAAGGRTRGQEAKEFPLGLRTNRADFGFPLPIAVAKEQR